MSGGNGPAWSFSSGTNNAGCSGIRRERALQVPDPSRIDELVVGTTLTLILHDGDVATVAVVDSQGAEVGAIIPDDELVECMRLGVPYLAVVKSASGAQILLSIQPA